jgi:hypothetical protein
MKEDKNGRHGHGEFGQLHVALGAGNRIEHATTIFVRVKIVIIILSFGLFKLGRCIDAS